MGDPSQPVILISEVASGLGLACTEVAIRQFKYNVVGISPDASAGLQPLLNSSSLHFVQGEVSDTSVHQEAIEIAMDEWGHIDAVVLIPDGNSASLKELLSSLLEKLENSQLPDNTGRIIIISEGLEQDLKSHVESITSSNPKLVHAFVSKNGSHAHVAKAIVEMAAGGLKKRGNLIRQRVLDLEELSAPAPLHTNGNIHYDLDPEDLQVGVEVIPGSNLKLRSRRHDVGMTALYIERYLNYGITREELQSDKPIIGIAQTGSDLSPCNRHHTILASRLRDGIRAAGGVPLEFPVHPIQETGKRPTAALDRNLAYLGLVEVLHGYPLDGVILTTGCDKTTPAMLMGAATVNIPSIVFSGGPMLDGYYKGELAGSGTIVWKARKLFAAQEINYDEYVDMVAASSTSVGHCSTMGTALSMNSLAEAVGMSLPGCAAIPGPYRQRGQMAYMTGKRIVEMVRENLTPSKIMTKEAFRNAVAASSALGASSNCPIHMIAIARHMGVEHSLEDWQAVGPEIPLLVDCQPAGRFLGERFYRAGGVPAVMRELLDAGKIDGSVTTVTGKTLSEDLASVKLEDVDREVIRAYNAPLLERAGYVVMRGNFMNSGILKMSVIDEEFRKRYLSTPDKENVLDGTAVVFEGTEDYHKRIEDPALALTAHSILVIRNSGPVGYPGSAEVVNMQPPAYLLKQGISTLPTLGDGRQSGTSASPSILNVSPESAVGGGLALLKTGDPMRIDLNTRRVDVLIPDAELEERRKAWTAPRLKNKTPWEEIYRSLVGQLESGGSTAIPTSAGSLLLPSELDPTSLRALKSTARMSSNALQLAQKLRSARDELIRATAKTAQLQKQYAEREKEVKAIEQECDEARKEVEKLNRGLDALVKEKSKCENCLKELKDENAFLEAMLKEGAFGPLAGELIEKEQFALDDKIALES
ncbi:Dihydroxy-acid dehydratase 1 [Gonapodya sp. JEL0774]|nr:Dihydroxy-acid dehydratase 1 [Gonapodya sp. JEL0774]